MDGTGPGGVGSGGRGGGTNGLAGGGDVYGERGMKCERDVGPGTVR